MNISLTPTLEKFVQDKVASEFYNFEITSKGLFCAIILYVTNF